MDTRLALLESGTLVHRSLVPEAARLEPSPLDAGDAPGHIEGYASTFNNEDAYGETFAPGAWKKTIKDRFGKKTVAPVPLLTKHAAFGGDVRDLAGGLTDAKEDEYGLWFHADFSRARDAQDTRIKVAEGWVRTVSVGFYPIKFNAEKRDERPDLIIHTEAALGEVTLTLWPANELAVLSEAKSLAQRLASRRVSGTPPTGRALTEAERDEAERLVQSLSAMVGELKQTLAQSESDAPGRAAVHSALMDTRRAWLDLQRIALEVVNQ